MALARSRRNKDISARWNPALDLGSSRGGEDRGGEDRGGGGRSGGENRLRRGDESITSGDSMEDLGES